MSLCRPAIRRIAIVLVASAVSVVTPNVVRAESLFGDEVAAPLDRSASRAAREELARARLMLTRAKAASSQALRSAEADIRAASGYRSLESAAARAIAEYHAARRPALTILFRDAEYTQLDREKEAARAEIRRITGNGTAPFEKVMPMAKRALAAGERMTRAESIVLALDPAVEDARIAMTDAFALLRRASANLREQVANHPQATLAQEDVAHARERVAEANANLAAALKAEAAADRARRNRTRNG